MKTPQEVKHIQELSDELMSLIKMDSDMPVCELEWILEAFVMKHCPDMSSLSQKIWQLCIEIDERTDDEIIHWLTDSILYHLKK